jgi:hypothetical protein
MDFQRVAGWLFSFGLACWIVGILLQLVLYGVVIQPV